MVSRRIPWSLASSISGSGKSTFFDLVLFVRGILNHGVHAAVWGGCVPGQLKRDYSRLHNGRDAPGIAANQPGNTTGA